MTTKPQTLEAILIRCAGATVPCPVSIGNTQSGPQERCTRCNFAGRHYIFSDEVRLQCPCTRYGESYPGGVRNWPKSQNHVDCQGRQWIPNPDPYAWRRSIRTLGCLMEIMIGSLPGNGDGDAIIVYQTPQDYYHSKTLAVTLPDENLYDQLAEATAILRLLMHMDNVKV